MLIISLSRVPYTVVLREYGQVDRKYVNIKLIISLSCVQSALNQSTVQTFTESEDTRCCVNTIFPPEDGHVNARNMSRIIV